MSHVQPMRSFQYGTRSAWSGWLDTPQSLEGSKLKHSLGMNGYVEISKNGIGPGSRLMAPSSAPYTERLMC